MNAEIMILANPFFSFPSLKRSLSASCEVRMCGMLNIVLANYPLYEKYILVTRKRLQL